MNTNRECRVYDQLGRLTKAIFPHGETINKSYLEGKIGQDFIESKTFTLTPDGMPAVAELPKRSNGDFKNKAMMVKLSSGKLIGWGDNSTGVLCNGIQSNTSSLPQEPLFDPSTTVPPFSATIVDWVFTNANLYVVYSNGWVYSGGANDYGQLGHGDLMARPFLKRIESFISGNLKIIKVWADGGYATLNGGGCVYFQADDYSMYGCGLNTAGNLGNSINPTTNQQIAQPCVGIAHTSTQFVVDVQIAVVGTSVSTYMIFNTRALFVAGYNSQYQLGVGNSTANVSGGFITALQESPVGPPSSGPASTDAISVSPGTTACSPFATTQQNTAFNLFVTGALVGTITSTIFSVDSLTTVSHPHPMKIESGGGQHGFAYALYLDNGLLHTWGYNSQNNLFQNTTTNPAPFAVASNRPVGTVAKVLMSKGQQGLTTTAQMALIMASGQVVYAGADVGQQGIPDSSGAYSALPMPNFLLDGSDSIVDACVHGTGLTQRWFILTANGKLYACGDNSYGLCSGGRLTPVTMAQNLWRRIAFS